MNHGTPPWQVHSAVPARRPLPTAARAHADHASGALIIILMIMKIQTSTQTNNDTTTTTTTTAATATTTTTAATTTTTTNNIIDIKHDSNDNDTRADADHASGALNK